MNAAQDPVHGPEDGGPVVAADADDSTDPGRHMCLHRRVPLFPGQPPAHCVLEAKHWPASDHRWEEDE